MIDACDTQITDLLRAVPEDHRISIPIQWSECGLETGHHLIPIGGLVHKAADHIDALTKDVERLQTLNEYANSRLAGLDILYEGNVSLRGKVKTLRYALIQLLGYARWAQKYCGVSMGMTNGGAIDNAKQAIKDTEVE